MTIRFRGRRNAADDIGAVSEGFCCIFGSLKEGQKSAWDGRRAKSPGNDISMDQRVDSMLMGVHWAMSPT